MKRIRGFVIGAVLLICAVAGNARAQEPVTLRSAFGHTLRSKLNDVDYRLTVVLPPDYDSSPNARYPTFYVMDGNRWAQLLAVLLPRFTSAGALPAFIVVGVDYPEETRPDAGRMQDYGPMTQRYVPMDPKRGAANYMRVIKEEIIPFVDSNYRTDLQDRGIGGHSMGGLFAAYALLHESETFRRFWISSPSLFYDDEVLFKAFESFRAKPIARPLYVFTDAGGDELPTLLGALERFGQQLVDAQPGKVILATLVVPNTTHATVVPSVFVPALQHLYTYRPRVIPAAADLARFAGQYKQPDGTVITLVTDGKDLLYRDSTIDYQLGALVRMIAFAPNKFSHRGDETQIEFPEGTGVPQRLHLRDGRTRQWTEAVRLPPQEIQVTEQKPRFGKPQS